MRREFVCGLVAAFSCATAAAGTSGSFVVGQRGHVLVPVSVNGGDARPFVVDTAASQTVLDAQEFRALGRIDAPSDAHPPHARGAHGTYAARPARVGSLALWQLEQRDQMAALMTLSELTHGKQPDFAGVLGLPFFSRFRLDFDYPQRRITLDALDDELRACDICDPDAAIKVMPLIGGLPSIPVTVNGLQMTALLDTGASRTLFNEAAISALGLADAGTGEAIGRVSIALGSIPARDHDAARIDLPIFRTLRLETEPAIILGIDYLASGRMVLDLQAGLVWFKPAS